MQKKRGPLHLRKTRPRRWPVKIIGLTGSIAMGKSTVADLLADAGVPVFSADAAVHALLGPKGRAVAAVAHLFPDALTPGGIDRQIVSRKVFGNPAALKALEGILHPMVRAERERFFLSAALQRRHMVVVEIPLLFESPQKVLFDAVIVVSAPAFLQRQRALRRAGMTAARLGAILARQMKDAEKRKRADIVVTSGLNKRETLRRVHRSLKIGR
jgi:dephospho-CoA kinase